MRQKAQEQSYNLSLSAQGRPSSVLGHVDKYLQERLTPDRDHSISKEAWPPTNQINGWGMENLLGRLQMLHYLIQLVVISIFANVKFLSVSLRFLCFTICKLCLS